MKIIEFNDEDFRDLDIDSDEDIDYKVDRTRVDTLREFLGYEFKTDGELVYAISGKDVIEIGTLKRGMDKVAVNTLRQY